MLGQPTHRITAETFNLFGFRDGRKEPLDVVIRESQCLSTDTSVMSCSSIHRSIRAMSDFSIGTTSGLWAGPPRYYSFRTTAGEYGLGAVTRPLRST